MGILVFSPVHRNWVGWTGPRIQHLKTPRRFTVQNSRVFGSNAPGDPHDIEEVNILINVPETDLTDREDGGCEGCWAFFDFVFIGIAIWKQWTSTSISFFPSFLGWNHLVNQSK